MKKTILHIIDDLGRGGAETMLVTVTKQLSEYNNIIVTLFEKNEFGEELKCDQQICLNLSSSYLQFPSAVIKLKKIIKENKVDVVHSHLFWSTIIARFATPKKIPLITTIHAFVASSLEYRPWRMRMMERLSYQFRKSMILAVAKGAMDEYFNFIGIKPHKTSLLYTFVDPVVFKDDVASNRNDQPAAFRVVCVGNLKEQKNHKFLLDAFQYLKQENIVLDIYGRGTLKPSLQKVIDEQSLNVNLKGQVKDIQNHLPGYDLFVMSSLYEGFALSVLEAMAMRMPMLLSDIDSFKEQCADTAMYFDLSNTDDFISKLKTAKQNKGELQKLGAAAKQRVLENFTLDKHLQQLKGIYADALLTS